MIENELLTYVPTQMDFKSIYLSKISNIEKAT